MTHHERTNQANRHILAVGRQQAPPPTEASPVADPFGGACRHCLRTLVSNYWATDILEMRYQMRRDGWSYAEALEELDGIVAAMRSVGETYEWLCDLEIKAEDIEQDNLDEQEIAALDAWLELRHGWEAEDRQGAGL